MKLIKKTSEALREGGVKLFAIRLLRFFYRKISKFLPQKYGTYNGVEVPNHKLGGSVINNKDKENPNYEEGIMNSLERIVEKEDDIVILGGGLGVTAVKSAKLCGEKGEVEVLEGSIQQVNKIHKTLNKNDIENVEVENAIVGENIDVWGNTDEAKRMKAAEIPDCDVLEIDIEGSELGVLEELKISPRAIIVETHGYKGSSTEKVKEILEEKEYDIKNVELAEKEEKARKNDIKVITAIKN